MGVGDIIATIISGLTFLWTIGWTVFSMIYSGRKNEKKINEFIKTNINSSHFLERIAVVLENKTFTSTADLDVAE